MLQKNTIITLDNNKKYTVLRTLSYLDKQYALISDFNGDNDVVEVDKDNKGICVSVIKDPKLEEIIVNKFLKMSLEEYNNIAKNN